MKMTIGIPVYNGGQWLKDALDSAYRQSGEIDLEVLLCNDGSNDNSLEVAKNYPVKIINQVNKGLASARNSLIMNMTGDFFLPLDADDILLSNCIERILELAEETKADIIAPSFKEFGLSDREVILMKNPKLEDFRIGNRVGYCQAIRRSALLEVGGYNPRMQEGYEDLALTINLLTRGYKLVTIPDILWMYRLKKESMYTKITPEVHKKLLAQINKDFPEAQLDF